MGGLGVGGGRESARQLGDIGCGCGGQGRRWEVVFRGDSVEVGQESGGPGCFCRVAPVFLGLVHEEVQFRPGRFGCLECPVAERNVQHPRLSNVFYCHLEVRADVRFLLPGIRVPEVDDEFSGRAVGVA